MSTSPMFTKPSLTIKRCEFHKFFNNIYFGPKIEVIQSKFQKGISSAIHVESVIYTEPYNSTGISLDEVQLLSVRSSNSPIVYANNQGNVYSSISQCIFYQCSTNSNSLVEIVSSPIVQINGTCFYECSSETVSTIFINSTSTRSNIIQFVTTVSCSSKFSVYSFIGTTFNLRNINTTKEDGNMHCYYFSSLSNTISYSDISYDSFSESIFLYGDCESNHIITYNNIYNVTSSYYIVSDSSEKIGITITLTSLIDNYISDETFFCISNNTIITFSESLISDEIQRLNSSRIIINNCKFEDSENMRTNYFLNTIYCEAPIEVIDENVLLNRLSNEEVILLIVVCVAVVAELAEVLLYLYRKSNENESEEVSEYEEECDEYSDFYYETFDMNPLQNTEYI